MIMLSAALVALVAAVVQRVTGIGFALVATPLLVLFLGPHDGVKVVVILGIVASVVMCFSMYRDIEWRRVLTLVIPAIVASPLAALLTWSVQPMVLLLFVGIAAVFSLVAPYVRGLSRIWSGRSGGILAGATAGFLHLISGLSGPPIIAYAATQKWDRAKFVATLQAVFIAYHVITIAWRGVPESSSIAEVAVLAAVVALGILLGGPLSRRIPEAYARIAMYSIAWVGAAVVLVRASLGLLGI